MATVIRLKRMGTKKKPFYRLVVTDSRKAVVGKYIEALGYYDPRKMPKAININKEKVLEWLKKGARPSDTVRSLFQREGILAKSKKRVIPETPRGEREIRNPKSETLNKSKCSKSK